MRSAIPAIVIALSLATSGLAPAVDVQVPGKKLVIRNGATSAGNRLVFLAKSPLVGTPPPGGSPPQTPAATCTSRATGATS